MREGQMRQGIRVQTSLLVHREQSEPFPCLFLCESAVLSTHVGFVKELPDFGTRFCIIEMLGLVCLYRWFLLEAGGVRNEAHPLLGRFIVLRV